ncbi:hypothetical protein [Gynurincola endophyticus]|uniref:hypothetical protein n=1 Tax=Gynurincola endophyticus TaxID=2479004 RepID=UPI000F8EC675|nr:hypothetical protein [Gynurincola endophyticus]
MKYSIFLLVIIVSSCTTSSLYKEIDRQVEEVNNEDSDIIKWEGDWNPSKKVFKKLRGKLKHSNHIIYIYTWVYTGMSIYYGKVSECLVHDMSSNKSYNIYIYKRKIKIQPKGMDFVFEEFLLKNYLKKNIDYLISLQNNNTEWVDHVLDSYHYILDYKKNKKIEYLVLESISFENGAPL